LKEEALVRILWRTHFGRVFWTCYKTGYTMKAKYRLLILLLSLGETIIGQ